MGSLPDARWVRPESLHVTLKFIGNKSAAEVEDIKQALTRISASAFEISFRGYGFFPTSKSPRVFWIGVEAGSQLGDLAKSVDESTAVSGHSQRRTSLQSASHFGAPRKLRCATLAQRR